MQVRLSKVFKASGVVVEQKSVRPTCSPFTPVGRVKGRHLKVITTKKLSDMETVREKRKKAGRPAKTIKKEIRASIRFSKLEYLVIRQKAAKAGIKASAYIREVVINGDVKRRLTDEERHFVRQLIGMSSNRAYHYQALRQSEVNKYTVYKAIMKALPQCKTMQDLEKKLQQQGIETQYKYKGQTTEKQGVSFKIGEDCFKGSKVDRKFSLSKVLLLNRANKVLGVYEVSTGGISGTVADPRLIFVAALKANACSLIISHNHPSGNLKPSRHDEELTAKIKQAGEFLDIKLLDHLIVTPEAYYSFGDEGIL